MKLIDQLIKQTSEKLGLPVRDVHEAIMNQFEYISLMVKGDQHKIEVSGLGYFQLNVRKLKKEYAKMSFLLKNMVNKRNRSESEGEKVLLQYKIDNLQEIIKDYELKLNLEKEVEDLGRDME